MQNEKITYISAKTKWFRINFKELWDYRDLILLFVKRNITTSYKQTILGPLWIVINPMLSTVVFTVIFNVIAGVSTDSIPPFLFYMSGNICWSYFSTTLNTTSNTFLANRAVMGRVYYPRLVTPIAAAFSRLISFCIQFVMFAVIWVFYLFRGGSSIRVTPMLLLVPLVVLQMMLLSVGCGIIISSVTTKYRDLAMLVGFGLQLWQYASPVAYGLQLIPERYMTLYMLNPVTPIITTFRYAMFGFGYFDLRHYMIGWGISLLLFLTGLILFSRIERTFLDTI